MLAACSHPGCRGTWGVKKISVPLRTRALTSYSERGKALRERDLERQRAQIGNPTRQRRGADTL